VCLHLCGLRRRLPLRGHVAEPTDYTRTDLNCSDVCATTASVLLRVTPATAAVTRAVVEACLVACRACADECAQRAEMHDHCRICADACRRCIDACTALLATL
jgi:hypothetical protein